MNKTKYLYCSRCTVKQKNISINNEQIQQVDSYRYLGSIINGNNSIEEEIKARIATGNRAYYANLNLFKSRLISKHAKIRLYNTIIRPVVSYGCETWVLKQDLRQKLLVFERKIYGPVKEFDGTWRILRNNELYDKIKHKHIINFIKSQRIRWFGHVHRMSNERIVKRISRWNPLQTRPVGKPKNRWEDDAIKDLKILKVENWVQSIQNRLIWRKIVEKAKTSMEL